MVGINELIEHGREFIDYDHLPNAFRAAQAYAGGNSGIATMPELLQAMIGADKLHDLWANSCTVLSEEIVGIDKKGQNYGDSDSCMQFDAFSGETHDSQEGGARL